MSRKHKVQDAIQKEVSDIIQNEFKDPRLGFITITGVEVTDDLRYARVFFSVLGSDEQVKKTKAALDSGLGFIRKLLAERIQLRFAPEVTFKLDTSGEYSVRIQQVLDQIKEREEGRKKKKEDKDHGDP
jgi:ribosome-binding factor A